MGVNIGKIHSMKRKFLGFVFISPLLFSACMPDSTMPSETEAQTEINVLPNTTAPVDDFVPEQMEALPDSLPKGIEIEFWHPWSGETANLIEELIEEYNTDNEWGITVNGYAHADERLLMQDFWELDAGEGGPDLIASPSFFLQLLQEKDFLLVDIDTYLDSPEWGFPEKEKPQFLPIFWDSDYANGTRIGIPAYRSAKFLYINQTWINELGFSDSLSSVEDFRELACAAAENTLVDRNPENDGLGGLVYAYDGYAILSLSLIHI